MSEGRQLLLLEDDIEFGIRLAMDLKAAGYEVSRHTTASAALEYLAENLVDLVIADILIKIQGEYSLDGGLKLISNLRQIQGASVPIIAISSMFQPQFGLNAVCTAAVTASTAAVTVGASETLAKPFETKELLFLVEKHLEKQLL